MNKNGFTLPVTTFFILAFLAIPVLFWGMSFVGNKDDVRGISTAAAPKDNQGLTAVVSASSGTWDLNIYLCQSKDECLSSLTSGKHITSLSGGKAVNRSVVVNYDETWEKYSVAKVYVKSGWGFGAGSYKILNAAEITFGDMNIIKTNTNEYQVILVNVSDIASASVGPFIFSDK